MGHESEERFIVKATSDTGLEMWIAFPRGGGHRVCGPRENASVFVTRGEAQSAIEQMPASFKNAGFKFTVEVNGTA